VGEVSELSETGFLSRKEAEMKMQYYWARASPYIYLITFEDDRPIAAFLPKHADHIINNADGSVTWAAREISIGLHSFIELTTGEKVKRTIYLPVCLVNPHTREMFKPLIFSTVDPKDGRLSSKDAECYIIHPKYGGFKINLPLAGLTMAYVMLQIMPPDFAYHFKFNKCVFCRSILEDVKNDR
jgi:hypothetical protein